MKVEAGRHTGKAADTAAALSVWFILLAAIAYLATAYAEYASQLWLAGGVLVVMFLVKLNPEQRTLRVVFLALSSFLVLRYFFWRTLYTIEFSGWASLTCALILYIAECYGILIALLGNFVNVRPITREPVPLPPDEELPTIDVLVPSYNESNSILEVTLLAAKQMRYPADKVRVFLCDDGGTDQKCNTGTDESRQAARRRRDELQRLCAEVGATYVTRPKNRGAKAGNLNEAFQKTDGDLVVIFDADHVPTTDFLEKTVGQFIRDPKLFLVQTPHFFTNPDPIERNLDTFHQMPSENEMFYRAIQRGLDFWNSAFFCGSGAVMRRTCLAQTGGLTGDTITEDAETALTLHARGYHSAYISTPMLSGLSPETMGGFIQQRIRWAQGMIQIFLLKCPLLLRGLTLPQRLCYFNSCIFWLFPFARIIYLLAPVAFLFFGLKIYAANWQTFMAYVVPYLIAVLTTSNYLYGRVRWSFVSELYELIQSVFTIPAIISVLISPRAPTFKVTPKGETLHKDFISPLAFPFYILAALNVGCIAAAVPQLIHAEGEGVVYPVAITLFWAVFNSVILLAALGALLERRQRRATSRMPVHAEAELVVEGRAVPCRIIDLSLGGAKLAIKGITPRSLENATTAELLAAPSQDEPAQAFHVHLQNLRYGEHDDELFIGAEFKPLTFEEKKAKVRLVTGSSERWMEFQRRRESRIGVLGSFVCLAYLGVKHSILHLLHLVGSLTGAVTGRNRRLEAQTQEA